MMKTIWIIGHALIHPRQWLCALEMARQNTNVMAFAPDQWGDQQFVLSERENKVATYKRFGIPVVSDGFQTIYSYRLDTPSILAHGLGHNPKPDWIFTLTEPCSAQSVDAINLGLYLKAKVAVFTWENILQNYPRPLVSYEEHVINKADKILCGNLQSIEIMKRKGADKEKLVHLQHCGIETSMFKPSDTEKDIPVLFVGRLAPEKGVKYIDQALEDKVTWLGSGDMTPRHGTCVGPRPYHELPAWFQRAKISVQYSHPMGAWADQANYVNLEAMACGVPVVTSNAGSIREFVPEFAGERLPPKHPTLLRRVVHALLNDPERLASMGKGGVNFIKLTLSNEVIAKKQLEVFE